MKLKKLLGIIAISSMLCCTACSSSNNKSDATNKDDNKQVAEQESELTEAVSEQLTESTEKEKVTETNVDSEDTVNADNSSHNNSSKKESITSKLENVDSETEPKKDKKKSGTEFDNNLKGKSNSLDKYAGEWELDCELTNSNLKNSDDIYVLFGSGLREYGALIQISEDGNINFYIGAGYGGSGTGKIVDDGIEAEITEDNGDNYGMSKINFYDRKIKGKTYLVFKCFNEETFWKKK